MYKLSFILLLALALQAGAQSKRVKVIAYYTGNVENLVKHDLSQIDQIIFSFLHLKDDTLSFTNPEKAVRLREITALKKQYPHLTVLVSLGGWGGCKTCSDVFSDEGNRRNFAGSVRRICDDFNADGIDLDWEYPGIAGYPEHAWKQEDVPNFTALVQALRDSLGRRRQISFAAGGFTSFLEQSIEWEKVMPLVDRVNLMTYDLVSGFSKQTGHHTPLYNSANTKESTDHCVQWLLQKGVPANKLVIGAAFYARIWKDVPDVNQGLYQPAVFEKSLHYKQHAATFTTATGWQMHWDDETKSPYAFNPNTKQFATFDSKRSVTLKTEYAKKLGLGGIMFWELSEDEPVNGLLQAIHDAAKR